MLALGRESPASVFLPKFIQQAEKEVRAVPHEVVAESGQEGEKEQEQMEAEKTGDNG